MLAGGARETQDRGGWVKGSLPSCSARADAWAERDAPSCLALIILLDQFSRNVFRGTPGAWATDAKALAVMNAGLALGFDAHVPPFLRSMVCAASREREGGRKDEDGGSL